MVAFGFVVRGGYGPGSWCVVGDSVSARPTSHLNSLQSFRLISIHNQGTPRTPGSSACRAHVRCLVCYTRRNALTEMPLLCILRVRFPSFGLFSTLLKAPSSPPGTELVFPGLPRILASAPCAGAHQATLARAPGEELEELEK